MPTVDFGPQRQQELVGVYEDPEQASHVVDLVNRIPGEHARMDEVADDIDSMQAEMRQEMEDSFMSPQAALLVPKEAAKTLAVTLPVATVVGALLTVPLALFPFFGLSTALRLLICAVVGATAGATVGFVIGAGFGVVGPAEPAAADRGVTVRAWPDSPKVREVMAAAHPIRLDLVDETGQPVDTITTEEQETDAGVVQQIEDRLHQPPGGDWSSVRADDDERDGTTPDRSS